MIARKIIAPITRAIFLAIEDEDLLVRFACVTGGFRADLLQKAQVDTKGNRANRLTRFRIMYRE